MCGVRNLLSLARLLVCSAALTACAVIGSTARADGPVNVLCVAYSGPFGLDPNVRNLENNLRAAAGTNVTSVIGPSAGDLADLLSQGSYDQVYIWDLDLFPPAVNQADKEALRAWWNAQPIDRNIVLDGRADAIFRENDQDELNLTKNIVSNFDARGRGLWIGAGYAPQAAQTANAYLAGLDPNNALPDLFAGAFSNLSAVAGTPNPLLTTPNAVNPSGLGYNFVGEFSRSQAPAVGPNGIALSPVITDAEGHRLITTNIPEPTGFLGVGAGAALFASRRRR